MAEQQLSFRLHLYNSVAEYLNRDTPPKVIWPEELMAESFVLITSKDGKGKSRLLVELNRLFQRDNILTATIQSGLLDKSDFKLEPFGNVILIHNFYNPSTGLKQLDDIWYRYPQQRFFVDMESSLSSNEDPNVLHGAKVAEIIEINVKRDEVPPSSYATQNYDALFREIIHSQELKELASSKEFWLEDMREHYRTLMMYKDITRHDLKPIKELWHSFQNSSGNLADFGKTLTGEMYDFWNVGIIQGVRDANTQLSFSEMTLTTREFPPTEDMQRVYALGLLSIILREIPPAFSDAIFNYANYFENPAQSIFIFDSLEQGLIINAFFGGNTSSTLFSLVLGYFDKFAPLPVVNSENLGVFFAAVMLHPRIRPIWDKLDIELELEESVLSYNTGRTIGTYSPDAPSEIDYLGFKPDVEAIAALAAFKKTPLPLAIALFGNWGSGKSSFMAQLKSRMNELGKKQHKALNESLSDAVLKDQESPFCETVVHITFNAWHYSDANLWACLMSEIFDALAKQVGEDKATVLQKRLNENLETAKAASEATLRELVVAKEQEATQAERLNKVREENKNKIDALTKLKAEDVEQLVLKNPEVQKKLAAVSQEINLTDLTEAIAELRKLKVSYQRAGQRTRQIFKKINEQNGWWKALLIGGLLVAPAAILILTQVEDGKALLGQIASFIALITSGILGFVKFVQPVLNSYHEKLDQIEAADQKIEELRNRERERLKREEENLQQELTRLQQALLVAQKNHDVATERLASVQQEASEQKNLDRQLVRFIKSRQGDGGYDKHLGIISVIRKDFEQLSNLLGFPKKSDDGTKDKYVLSKPLIDRIVLYIDDLDRCKSDRVVEVLEAVHLLMAFDIFVVVVGVDPRWVTKALKEKYGVQFDAQKDMQAQEEAVLPDGRNATTYDYLEKIFQVPFIVRPMESKAAHTLIDKLFDGQIRKPEVAEKKETDTEQEKTGGTSTGKAPGKTVEVSVEEAAQNIENVRRANEERERKQKEETLRIIREQAAGLLLSPEEVEYMKHLSPLVGETPRTLIRYANLYRLLRVHEKTPVYTSGSEENLQHLKCIMLLLAAAVGSGTKAESFFSSIGASNKNNLLDFWKSLESEIVTDEQALRWQKFLDDAKDHKENIGALPMNLLRDYAPVVARFSFRTLHIAVESPEKKPGTTNEKVPQQ